MRASRCQSIARPSAWRLKLLPDRRSQRMIPQLSPRALRLEPGLQRERALGRLLHALARVVVARSRRWGRGDAASAGTATSGEADGEHGQHDDAGAHTPACRHRSASRTECGTLVLSGACPGRAAAVSAPPMIFELRLLYGNMNSSFLGPKRVTTEDCLRAYLRIPSLPVARAEAGGLPAAHRHLQRQVAHLVLVHVGHARLEPATRSTRRARCPSSTPRPGGRTGSRWPARSPPRRRRPS